MLMFITFSQFKTFNFRGGRIASLIFNKNSDGINHILIGGEPKPSLLIFTPPTV